MARSWYPGRDNSSGTVPPLAPVFTYYPTIDGSSIGLTASPLDCIKAGKFNRVPTIMGTNQDEGTIFLFVIPFLYTKHQIGLPVTARGLHECLSHVFSNSTTINRIYDAYPRKKLINQNVRAAAILRDFIFVCPTRRALAAIEKQGFGSTWQYRFSYPHVNPPGLGDYHASEIGFVFRHLKENLHYKESLQTEGQ
ncbi:hypothetical protein CYMTET_48333 [Cymbomonas tetramitiformis]|uniref:Carboxylesterase type B domain-containing protein n=1 Tax=Cymbomonas tetramitiformis TaxID=36881 RepID=A0AAE0BSH6_9CHLO|nr:hypothetical protein CYMTET_48333 [Cymbomonas tetramitiformis]